MDSAPVRGDSTEKTITLGLLDLMPATRQALPVEQFPGAGTRLPSGFSVMVRGARVVRERPRAADEASFVMRPSTWLRLRRGARAGLAAAVARARAAALVLFALLGSAPARVRRRMLERGTQVGRRPPEAAADVAGRAGVRERLRDSVRLVAPLARACAEELRAGRRAFAGTAVDLRSLSGAQRRSVAVAFLAGIVLATLVTSLAM